MKVAVVRDGAVTLPIKIRRALGLENETPLSVSIEGSRIVLKPWTKEEKSA